MSAQLARNRGGVAIDRLGIDWAIGIGSYQPFALGGSFVGQERHLMTGGTDQMKAFFFKAKPFLEC